MVKDRPLNYHEITELSSKLNWELIDHKDRIIKTQYANKLTSDISSNKCVAEVRPQLFNFLKL